MICKNCGRELPDDARFCTACGQTQEQAATTAEMAEAIITGKNKKHPVAILAVLAIVVVAAVALIVAAATGAFAGPEAKLAKAVAKSAQAYAQASDAIALPEVAAFGQDGNVQQSMTLVLSEVPGMDDTLSGLGLRLDTAARMTDRKMRIDLSLLANKEDKLADLTMIFDDAVLSLGSPTMVEGTWLGVNTETLGTDLIAMGEEGEGLSELSFNIFELSESYQKMGLELPHDEEAGKAFMQAITTEKADSREVNVHGHTLKCAGYRVTVPAEAVTAYLYAQVKAYRTSTLVEDIANVYADMGFDAEELGLDLNADDDLAAELEEAIDYLERELDDISIDVYVSGGYVMAALGEMTVEDEALAFEAYFGGGENYVDDFSFTLQAEDGCLTYTAKGDHGGKNGRFTDKSELLIESSGQRELHLELETAYAPDGAFSLRLQEAQADAFTLIAAGRLTADKESFSLQLEELAIVSEGEKLGLQLDYTLGVCESLVLPDAPPQMILQMTEDEFYALGEEIGYSFGVYLQKLMEEQPWIAELFLGAY